MIAKTVIGLFAVTVILNSSADEFKMSSLIVPQGVSYRVTPIRFTRDVKVVEGSLDTKRIKSTDSSGDNKSSSEDHSALDNTTTTDTTFETKAGASGKAGASLWTGIHASAEVHGSLERTSSDVGHSSRSSATKSDTSSNRENSFRDADALEDSMKGKYGDWYLTFTITLKNLDMSDTCFVKPPTGGQLSAVVVGLTQPVIVPCERQQSIAIGIDEVVCKFSMPVHDQQLLKELKALAESGGMEKLSAQIDGANFPIISQTTGKNVLQEIKLAEMKNPTTEISLQFGEAKVLSPWRVKHRFGRSSGRRGQFVTLRDVLDAVDEKIAEDDSMPEHVCEFEGGKLVSVCGAKFGEVHRGVDGRMLPALLLDDGAEIVINPLDEKMLSRAIRDFKKISFCNVFNLSEEEFKMFFFAAGRAALKEEFFKILKSCGKECDISDAFIAYLRFISDLPDDIEKGVALYESEYKRTKDMNYLGKIVDKYLVDIDSFKDDSAVVAAVRMLMEKDSKWVLDNRGNVGHIQCRLLGAKKYEVLDEFLRNETFVTDTNKNQTVVMLMANAEDVRGLARVLEKNEKALRRVIDKSNDSGFWPLQVSALNGNVEMCRLLLKYGADPNLPDGKNGSTPLDFAVWNGCIEVVKMMVEEYGAKSDRAVYDAAFQGKGNIVSYFIDKWNFDVNHVDAKYGTLLSMAAAGGQTQLCKFLIGKGAKVDLVPDVSWFTPLERAVINGHKDVVEYLLSVDGSLKIEHNEVLEKCSEDMRRYLLGIRKIDNKAILLNAIKRDNATNVYEIVSKDRNLFTAEIDGSKSLLGCIVLYDAVESARVLKKLGFDMNYCKEGYLTPIQYAAKIGRLKVFKFLVEECALPFGDCLEIAVDSKQKNILSYLFELEVNGVKAVDINNLNYGNYTLLSAAAYNGDNEMCEWLIAKGAKLDVADNKGWLPIERAVQRDKIDTVRFLVENYRLSRDTIEASAMDAAGNGSLSSLKYFINNCNVSPLLARKDGKRNSGFLLAEASSSGQLKIVQYLVEEKGVPVDYTPVARDGFIFDDDFYSALHMAIVYGKQEVVKYLRSKGAKKE